VTDDTEEKTEETSEGEAETEAEPGPEGVGEAETKAEAEAEPAEEAKPLPGAGTPAGEELVRANAAFEAGNYQLVREICAKLGEAPDDEVARAARELRARTAIDPVQIGVLVACLALFSVIVYIYVL
jgi:hypothetical protein